MTDTKPGTFMPHSRLSRFLRSMAVLLCLGATGAARAQADVALGYVLDVAGQVTLMANGKRQLVEIFDRLPVDQTLNVPHGAKVVFMFRPERVEYTFIGPATLHFSTAGLQVRNGNAGVARALPPGTPARPEVSSRTRPEVRANAIGMIFPEVGETVLTNRPLLSWSGALLRQPFDLTITDCGADLLICDGVPQRTSFKSAAWRPSEDDALEWGHIYRWSVKSSAKGGRELRGWFMVVAPDQLELLSVLHPGESTEVSKLVLYAQALEEVGARYDAQEIWRQLAASRPDQRGLMCKAAGRPVEQCRRIGEGF